MRGSGHLKLLLFAASGHWITQHFLLQKYQKMARYAPFMGIQTQAKLRKTRYQKIGAIKIIRQIGNENFQFQRKRVIMLCQ